MMSVLGLPPIAIVFTPACLRMNSLNMLQVDEQYRSYTCFHQIHSL
jgi:hypothetical protein